MSVSGVCAICQSAQATETCPRCGANVCTEHYDRDRGMCQDCAGGLTQT